MMADSININDIDFSELEKEYQTEEQINRFIESLDISAEAKLLISKIAVASLNVGDKIIKIGKKIIEIVIMLSKKYPNTFIGLIISALIISLIAQIPLIGSIISSFIGPLLIALGLTMGAIQDFKDNAFARKIAEATKMFEPLNQAESKL